MKQFKGTLHFSGQEMSSLEEEASPAQSMESSLRPSGIRRVMLARGGALTKFSGIGGAHAALVNHHNRARFPDLHLIDVMEYPEQRSGFSRLRFRWFSHPKRVAKACKQRLGPDDVLHITDQEQAHLTPPRHANRPKVIVTVHDLFHLFPETMRIPVGNEGDEEEGETVEIGDSNPGFFRRRDLQNLRDGLARADLLVCDSEHTRSACEHAFPGVQTMTVPLGIDVDAYKAADIQDKNKKFTMLFIGSSDPRKRLDFLCDMLMQLEDSIRQDAVLHIVGGVDNDGNKLSGRFDFECHVHASLGELALMHLRHTADVLLFPSAAEGFGYPPLESMAAGCPVLCSDLPAHNELLPEGTGLPPGDVQAWLDALNDRYQHWRASEEKAPDEALVLHARKFSEDEFVRKMGLAYGCPDLGS